MISDASVVVKWFFPEEDSDRAIDLVTDQQLRAPALLATEVGNAIWKKLRRGEVVDLLDALARLADLGQVIELVADRMINLTPRALELAVQFDLAIYDCVDLALAGAEGDLLVTADAKFVRKLDQSDLARHVQLLA